MILYVLLTHRPASEVQAYLEDFERVLPGRRCVVCHGGTRADFDGLDGSVDALFIEDPSLRRRLGQSYTPVADTRERPLRRAGSRIQLCAPDGVRPRRALAALRGRVARDHVRGACRAARSELRRPHGGQLVSRHRSARRSRAGEAAPRDLRSRSEHAEHLGWARERDDDRTGRAGGVLPAGRGSVSVRGGVRPDRPIYHLGYRVLDAREDADAVRSRALRAAVRARRSDACLRAKAPSPCTRSRTGRSNMKSWTSRPSG